MAVFVADGLHPCHRQAEAAACREVIVMCPAMEKKALNTRAKALFLWAVVSQKGDQSNCFAGNLVRMCLRTCCAFAVLVEAAQPM